MSGPVQQDDGARIAVGVIRRPHGIHGEASVELWTDSAERLEELPDVTLVSPDSSELRPAAIESVRAHGGRALVSHLTFDIAAGASPPHEPRGSAGPLAGAPTAFGVSRTAPSWRP